MTPPKKEPTAEALLYRSLPSMDAALSAVERSHPALTAALPRPLLRDLAEEFFNQARQAIREGRMSQAEALTLEALLPSLVRHIEVAGRPRFRRVLNATGVVLHTNLGRSLLAEEAVRAVAEAAAAYSNLEFDLETGERGSRYSHVEGLIKQLTGAEAALVVNNNAAAVLLLLDTFAKGREVIVSRGELVEIGGSFRIPAVMEKSGCILREVGATNRTHLADYAAALSERTAAIMKVHTSNYRIIGFHSEVGLDALAPLAATHGIPLMEDLGSGNLVDFAALGQPLLGDEPTAAAVLARGADVVTFSGDKLLGGPQAGIIAGKAAWIDPIRKNPLNRALRIDKLTLAALEATLRLYLDPALARRRVPTLRMLLLDEAALKEKAAQLKKLLDASLASKAECRLAPGASRVGGGSFPEKDLPTTLIRVTAAVAPSALRAALLRGTPPLVGRVEENAFCLDPRTLDESEFSLAAEALRAALA